MRPSPHQLGTGRPICFNKVGIDRVAGVVEAVLTVHFYIWLVMEF